MKIILIILIILIIFFLINYNNIYRYKEKDPSKIYVTSKGKAYEWNKKIFDKLLENIFPEKEIVYENISNPDLLLVSHFFDFKDYILRIEKNTPYITWSGEPKRVNFYKNGVLNLLSLKKEKEEDKEIPYFLTSFLEGKFDLEKIKNKNFKKIEERENFVAYISSRCVKKRDDLFKLLDSKKKKSHALGKCCNNKKKIEGDWSNLSNIYENYRFGFAMENCKKEGYITEKILNIFSGGAIPIFWGDSEGVKKFFNKESYIDISDFGSLEEASDYIIKLDNDLEKLKSIQAKNIFKDNNFFLNPYKILQDIDYKDLRKKIIN